MKQRWQRHQCTRTELAKSLPTAQFKKSARSTRQETLWIFSPGYNSSTTQERRHGELLRGLLTQQPRNIVPLHSSLPSSCARHYYSSPRYGLVLVHGRRSSSSIDVQALKEPTEVLLASRSRGALLMLYFLGGKSKLKEGRGKSSPSGLR